MDSIYQLMHKDMQNLNDVIHKDLDSNVVLIKQISSYIINSGGKRLRPLLTLVCGRIAGIIGYDLLLYKMAAMVEYIHTATLIHDDVVDESNLRRGRQTTNAIFGNAASVLVGDFIYTRAFEMMTESNSIRLLRTMASITNRTSEGEVLQLLNIGNSALTEEEYFKVITAKTSALFEATAITACIIAKSSQEIENSLAIYTKNIGIAFQITDDILDYTGQTKIIGKNIGDDLLEGKITLPLIYAMKYSTHEEKEILKHAIELPGKADLMQVTQIIISSKAIIHSQDIAKQYINLAIKELGSIANSVYKNALIELANYITNRIN